MSVRLAVIVACGAGAAPVLAVDVAAPSSIECAVPDKGDDAQARSNALFARGRALFRKGETGAACACFEASQRALPGRGGTLLNLGLCRADLGQLVPAYEALDEAERIAAGVGDHERAEIARERLRSVEQSLAWLALVWPNDRPATHVAFQLDGVTVPRHRWSAVPVEPGDHTLFVQFEGAIPQRMDITLRASERRTVHVAPLALRPATPESSAASPAPLTPREASPVARSSLKQRAAWSLTIAGFTVGAFTGAWAIADKRSLERHCPQGECSPKWMTVAHRGRTLSIVSGTALALGVVGSLYTWILSRSASHAEPSQPPASSRMHGGRP